ncbi:hypothetical protein [Escherichia phage vB_EcoS_IME542]|uniref:Uncharacterized protein n=1 Tax=Escherichia phage vB_EcoS_IME542 TaxID=2507711 RepID=A0A410T641_9CAUD|nr:hypothetical protein HOV01_gp45 [Escherichia phage vB_EcoS_IME542]QAU04417.1 hypothetical protein [Escherichia phage vB_EcoS_IME542]
MAIRSVALAGMVADTSLYNIDGACVVGGTAPINVGVAVKVYPAPLIDGHKVVVATGIAANQAVGVVVNSHYETPDGTAKAKEAVNVMTDGRIWMRTTLTRAPTFGAPVLVSATGVVGDSGAATGWTFAGGFIPNTGTKPQDLSVDGALVEVQVKQK